MNSGGTNTTVETLNYECVRLQLFRCSFQRVVERLGKHLRLDDVERELDKICRKNEIKKIYECMIETMKTDLSDCVSELNSDINCKLKILDEASKEGVYDTQPKWRPSGNVEKQLTSHIIAEKLTLKEQLERDLEKETAEVHRLREKIAKKRKIHLKYHNKYNNLSKQYTRTYSSLESLSVLERDILSKMKRKFDELE